MRLFLGKLFYSLQWLALASIIPFLFINSSANISPKILGSIFIGIMADLIAGCILAGVFAVISALAAWVTWMMGIPGTMYDTHSAYKSDFGRRFEYFNTLIVGVIYEIWKIPGEFIAGQEL
jgi:hypothetical protein